MAATYGPNTWAMFSALASLLGVLITLLSVAYITGRLTQKVAENHTRLDDHEDKLDRHDERLSANAIDLARLHEWKSGFNAAAKIAGGGVSL